MTTKTLAETIETMFGSNDIYVEWYESTPEVFVSINEGEEHLGEGIEEYLATVGCVTDYKPYNGIWYDVDGISVHVFYGCWA